MSKVVKGIKKAFRSVVKVVRKIWKPLVIAAAVYFTAGAALSYFGAGAAATGASAFSGAVATGTAGVAGATTGAGAFAGAVASGSAGMAGVASSVATGVNAFAGATASGTATYSRTAMALAAGRPGIPSAINAATTAPASNAFAGATTSGSAGTTLGGRIAGAIGGMSGIERAMYVQTLLSGVSGLLAPKPPTPDETAQANARFRGSYFGVNEEGQQEFDPVASYNQFWQPRAGESYRGAIPDNRDTPAPAPAPASPAATAAASRPGQSQTLGQPRDTARSTSPPSFLQGDDNADGNAGYYSPNDNYG